MATWFAQNSSVNIDSVNQWNSAANGSGSWLTWASLGASDILVANGKTGIIVNVSFTCAEITNEARGGTLGGSFSQSAGTTITANVTKGQTVVLLNISGAGTRYTIGNITIPASASSAAVLVTSATINHVGDVTGAGGSSGGGHGISLVSSTAIVVGTVSAFLGGSDTYANYGINVDASSSLTLTGNVQGGTHGSDGAPGIANSGNAIITGNVTSRTTSQALQNTGTLELIGDITPFSTGYCVWNTGTMYFTGKANTTSAGGIPFFQRTPRVRTTGTLEFAFRAYVATVNTSERRLYSGGVNLGQPGVANVRSGTTFGAASEYTGTLAVPSPTLVAVGVATDNTVGSYAPTGGLDAAGVRSAIGLATANLDTQLGAIKTSADAALRPATAGRTIAVDASGAVQLDSAITAQLQAIEDDSAAAVGYLTTLVGRLTANAAAAIQNLWHMITGTGASSKFTSGALENSAGASGGDWTNTEKAQIRYRLGLDGTATAPTEPDVDPIVITPATGIMTTGYLVTRVKGVATAGIKIYYQHVQEPTADRGSSYDDTIYSASSNSEGIAELSLVKGGLYYIWRTSATRPKDLAAYRVLNIDGSLPGSTLALPSHVGH